MPEAPITELLNSLKGDGENPLGDLLPLVYDELRRLARVNLSRERPGHTLQPTALVHEAYLKLVRQRGVEWQDRAHFFGIASRLMRQILIDHARSRNSKKRGGEFGTKILLDETVSYGGGRELDIIAVDEALLALEALDERQARVVEMKFFGGLSIDEIADVMSVSPATVKREWQTARLFLARMLDPHRR